MSDVLKRFELVHAQARLECARWASYAPEGTRVEFIEPRRSSSQNRALWPVLQAFAENIEWRVNGHKTKLSPEDWKDILTAAFTRENARMANGLDGGFVFLGLRTSKMSKKQFGEFLEFVHATAIARGIQV